MAYNLSGIRMAFEPQRSLGEASVEAGYTAVGTALAHPCSEYLIYNQTDALLQFSFDGIHDHFVLDTKQYWVNDNNSNKSNSAKALMLPEGATLYVKEIGTPSTGSVYFSVIYADSGY